MELFSECTRSFATMQKEDLSSRITVSAQLTFAQVCSIIIESPIEFLCKKNDCTMNPMDPQSEASTLSRPPAEII